MSRIPEAEYTFRNALENDPDFASLGQNRLFVFTLYHYLGAEDVTELAADAITDWGDDDKKADGIYLDLDNRRAVIAQAYLAQQWGKRAAKANKTSDLTTATSWVLRSPITKLPATLQPKAKELRDGLKSGDITRIELWYVHNCHESKNVKNELEAAAATAFTLASAHTQNSREQPTVAYKEYGLESIEELYRSRDQDILVDDRIQLPRGPIFEESASGWKAVVFSAPAKWIHELHKKHGSELVSANLRSFLGTRGSINSAIINTTQSEPDNFWAYNNGITCVTKRVNKTSNGRYSVNGLSIINGAQTAGALAEVQGSELDSVRVLCRIVECSSKSLIRSIILYNNTQNAIKPSDIVSNDGRQTDLARFFDKYGIAYIHRRTSDRNSSRSISASKVGPAICSFHGDPQTAGRNSGQIFLDQSKYDLVFFPGITAEHVFLVTTLSSALDRIKYNLKERVDKETATKIQLKQYDILRFSMSKHFITYIIGAVAEEIVSDKIANLAEWKCKPAFMSNDAVDFISAWEETILALLPQIANCANRHGDAYDVTRSRELSSKVAEDVKAVIASLGDFLSNSFAKLRNCTSY